MFCSCYFSPCTVPGYRLAASVSCPAVGQHKSSQSVVSCAPLNNRFHCPQQAPGQWPFSAHSPLFSPFFIIKFVLCVCVSLFFSDFVPFVWPARLGNVLHMKPSCHFFSHLFLSPCLCLQLCVCETLCVFVCWDLNFFFVKFGKTKLSFNLQSLEKMACWAKVFGNFMVRVNR